MEAFETVEKRMIYVGMELFCDTIAQGLPLAEQLDSPHIFPDDFFDRILAAAHEQ